MVASPTTILKLPIINQLEKPAFPCPFGVPEGCEKDTKNCTKTGRMGIEWLALLEAEKEIPG